MGSLAGCGDGQILLPGFASRQSGGLYVDAAKAEAEGGFVRFVDRVFSAGVRFSGLDHDRFMELLHGGEVKPGMQRLADDLVPFEPERRALYKSVRILGRGERAEYVFEPVFLDQVVQEPACDEAGAGGGAERVVKTPTKLDFDEFVAALWDKGVRFGIDAAAVRQAIAMSERTRIEVAHWLEPTPGRDASIEEQTKALHRDNSPRILSDGRADLRQFKNRFPQIAVDVRLLKKMPRVPGKPGRRITGELVEPPLPRDFDLAALSGPGTRVDRTREAEYIVSSQGGFLHLDPKSNLISVTDKIVGREGISLRTTGNLSLAGEEYEEHGEVQEQRIVEGKHMTFHDDVFGVLLSSGGRVRLMRSITGGKAVSRGGEIVVAGRASRSHLEAPEGDISVRLAEGSLLIGGKVTVERAVGCRIIADIAEIGRAEGCVIAARSIHAGATASWHEAETRMFALVPDFTAADRRLSELKAALARLERDISAKRKEIETFKAQPEVVSYIALEARVRQGAVSFTPAQEESWNRAAMQLAPVARRLTLLTTEAGKLWEDRENRQGELDEANAERAALCASVACVIDRVAGETIVRSLRLQAGAGWMSEDWIENVKAAMKAFDSTGDRLFSGASGKFSWRHANGEDNG